MQGRIDKGGLRQGDASSGGQRPGPAHTARFRFYAELNDFLVPWKRQRDGTYAFNGRPGIKDAIEAQGVPHTEVAVILVDGRTVGFDHRLEAGARVAVFPSFRQAAMRPAGWLAPPAQVEPRIALPAGKAGRAAGAG